MLSLVLIAFIPFTVCAQAPIISSFSPTSGGQIATIVIMGNNFTGTTAVSFGGTAAFSFTVNSPTQITAIVNRGSTGDVMVTNPAGSGLLFGFTYTGPVITSFSPVTASMGDTVTINGSGFTGTNDLRFGNVLAASFVVVSDQVVKAVVGQGTSGAISINTPLGNNFLNGFSYLGPVITSFSPSFPAPGTTVILSGNNFTGATAVDFEGLPATSYTVVNDNTIHAIVGVGYSGRINVTGPGGIGFISNFLMQPVITSIAPLSGPLGTTLNISGYNFSTAPLANTVYLGQVKATVLSSGSATIQATVPGGASYQPLSVTVNNFTAGYATPFITTFSGGGTFNQSSFTIRESLTPLGSSLSSSFSIADFNGDQKADVAFINNSGNTLTLLRNNSVTDTLLFSTITSTLATGNGPVFISAGDVNSDGKNDILVSNGSANTISVIRNITSIPSNMSFATKVDLTTGSSPRGNCLQDMDGDGRPDIIVVNQSANTVSLLRNTGITSISFAAKIDFATGTSPQRVIAVDLDGDAKADLVTANSTGGNISVFRNISTGTTLNLDTRTDISSGTNTTSLAAGDLDMDGKVDIITCNAASNTLSIFRNTSVIGVVSFAPKMDIVTDNVPNTCLISDYNGDGWPDIIVENLNAKTISVYRNTGVVGTISLAAKEDYSLNENPNRTIAADLNGDGKQDIVFSTTSAAFNVLRNKMPNPPVITSFSPSVIETGDSVVIQGKNFSGAISVSLGGTAVMFTIISDNRIVVIGTTESGGDVVVTTPYGSTTLGGLVVKPLVKISSFSPLSGPIGTVISINGSGFGTTPASNIVYFGAVRANVLTANTSVLTVSVPTGASNRPFSITTGGLTAFSSKAFLVTFTGAGAEFTANSFEPKIDSVLTNQYPEGISISDFNMDGKADVVTADHLGGIHVYRNSSNGDISFGQRQTFNSGKIPLWVSTTDLDRDGMQDVIVSNYGDVFGATLYKNNSTINGTIALGNAIGIDSFGIGTIYVSLADFDNDCKPDMAFNPTYGGSCVLFRNTSTVMGISIGPKKAIAAGGTGRLASADLDGDGKTDLVFVHINSNVSYVKNNSVPGIISFGSSTSLGTSPQPWGLALGDLDGDDKPDLVVTTVLQTMSVYRNTSTLGNISFGTRTDYPVACIYSNPAIGDLDGDGKAEIVIPAYGVSKVAVFKNISTPGNLSFLPKVEYPVGMAPRSVEIGDLTNDGKPDLVVTNEASGTVSFLRNKVSEPGRVEFCPPVANTILTSSLSGVVYQWQVDINDGNGFLNISDNTTYSGTGTVSLQLTAIPSSWYGHKFRCVVDGNNSDEQRLVFKNIWTGAISQDWENPGNWSCGTIPDDNTDVYINNGNVVLNSNRIIRSLVVRNNAQLTTNPGFNLTILH